MLLLPSELSAFGSLCDQSLEAYQHSISLRKTSSGGRVFTFAKPLKSVFFALPITGIIPFKSVV